MNRRAFLKLAAACAVTKSLPKNIMAGYASIQFGKLNCSKFPSYHMIYPNPSGRLCGAFITVFKKHKFNYPFGKSE